MVVIVRSVLVPQMFQQIPMSKPQPVMLFMKKIVVIRQG